MFVTTTLIAIQIPYVKHLPWVVGVAWFLLFGFIDGLFYGAALRKVPRGAWITLLVGCVLCVVILLRCQVISYQMHDIQSPLHDLLDMGERARRRV